MEYSNYQLAKFIARPNRFVAECSLADEVVIAHVKNTGRGKEVFLPEATVSLVYDGNPKRKTHYDLVAIKKGDNWLNIDSQITNPLVAEGLASGKIQLPFMETLTVIKREVTYENSKFDFYLEDEAGQRAFLEVKGMTLANGPIGAFPDAPTLRGLKHVEELQRVLQQGYKAYVLFVAQSAQMQVGTIHRQMQPALYDAFKQGLTAGLQVLCYNCLITPQSIQLLKEIPFDLDAPFIDPNARIGGS